jgi:hypothetical protein
MQTTQAENEHTMRSLRSCWLVINIDCQKWAGVQAVVDVLTQVAQMTPIG